MPSPDASHIASLLKEFGLRATLYGGNPYRAKAYLRAADSVALLTEPIGELIAQDRLRETSGVGEAIAGVITTLFQTGSHPSLEKMREDIPDSVLEMLTIPGLRPEKVLKLHNELGIDTTGGRCQARPAERRKGAGPGASAQNSRWLGGKAKLTGCKTTSIARPIFYRQPRQIWKIQT